jgi:hypothetical protein
VNDEGRPTVSKSRLDDATEARKHSVALKAKAFSIDNALAAYYATQAMWKAYVDNRPDIMRLIKKDFEDQVKATARRKSKPVS